MDLIGLIVSLVCGAGFYLFFRTRKERQVVFIKNYVFPLSIGEKIKEKYPHLTDENIELVFKALRDYFYYCNKSKKRMVSMPSQVVDIAWHEFILFTRNYDSFCKKGIGRFLHHTPTEQMPSSTLAQDGIKRAWRLACAKEKIKPSHPVRLPLIFSIDALLNIEDGFRYSMWCMDRTSPDYGGSYCAGHIGCAAGCAGSSGANPDSGGLFGGFFDGSGGSSDCGGGGGCGGGGD